MASPLLNDADLFSDFPILEPVDDLQLSPPIFQDQHFSSLDNVAASPQTVSSSGLEGSEFLVAPQINAEQQIAPQGVELLTNLQNPLGMPIQDVFNADPTRVPWSFDLPKPAPEPLFGNPLLGIDSSSPEHVPDSASPTNTASPDRLAETTLVPSLPASPTNQQPNCPVDPTPSATATQTTADQAQNTQQRKTPARVEKQTKKPVTRKKRDRVSDVPDDKLSQEELERRNHRRELNKRAAQNSRARKIARMQELEEKVSELQQENEQLRGFLASHNLQLPKHFGTRAVNKASIALFSVVLMTMVATNHMHTGSTDVSMGGRALKTTDEPFVDSHFEDDMAMKAEEERVFGMNLGNDQPHAPTLSPSRREQRVFGLSPRPGLGSGNTSAPPPILAPKEDKQPTEEPSVVAASPDNKQATCEETTSEEEMITRTTSVPDSSNSSDHEPSSSKLAALQEVGKPLQVVACGGAALSATSGKEAAPPLYSA